MSEELKTKSKVTTAAVLSTKKELEVPVLSAVSVLDDVVTSVACDTGLNLGITPMKPTNK